MDLHGSTGIGCTDTVQADGPAAFVAHYEKAMADSGWTVARDGSGVFGRSDVGGLRFDPLEGNSVGVYALSPDEYGG
ncbi:hypothetical protein [Knoellia sp. LjRoot47]|uniref:hypothetical protein n=1 Tax=Knoellia sp. LjRoot47 TaxID=3342330 RepID=UPI003ECD1866